VQDKKLPDIVGTSPGCGIVEAHDVGGLLENKRLASVEPLKEPFKEEVRKIGESLGLDHNSLYRPRSPVPVSAYAYSEQSLIGVHR